MGVDVVNEAVRSVSARASIVDEEKCILSDMYSILMLSLY